MYRLTSLERTSACYMVLRHRMIRHRGQNQKCKRNHITLSAKVEILNTKKTDLSTLKRRRFSGSRKIQLHGKNEKSERSVKEQRYIST